MFTVVITGVGANLMVLITIAAKVRAQHSCLNTSMSPCVAYPPGYLLENIYIYERIIHSQVS